MENSRYNRFTPNNITELKDNEIFVFGSNLAGQHWGGAARAACTYFGAEWGNGVGFTGQCYAIPTMHGGVKDIKPYVDKFIEDAKDYPEKKFLVTAIGCVDKDTEFLTPIGWKKISDYKDEYVAQYNLDEDTISFVKPINYIKELTNEFIVFKTKYGIDQVVSPDHKCLTFSSFNKKPCILSAIELYQKDHKFVCGASNLFKTTFKIKRNGLDINDDILRVLVMISADGSICFNKIWLKFRKERKIQRAIKLLTNANIDFSVKKHKYETGIVFKKTDIITKRPLTLWEANEHQLNVIGEECLLWDGDKRNRFNTRLKEEADFIQYCFSAIGKRAVIYEQKRRGGIDYVVRFAGNEYTSLLSHNKENKRGSSILKVENEYKYCFTLESGFWVARRNGNIFITGNCGIAGFTPREIAPLFKACLNMENVYLPKEFVEIIK